MTPEDRAEFVDKLSDSSTRLVDMFKLMEPYFDKSDWAFKGATGAARALSWYLSKVRERLDVPPAPPLSREE